MAEELQLENEGKRTTIFNKITEPLRVIRLNGWRFALWFLFAVLAGQIGVACNVIIRVINGDLTLAQSLYLDSENGSFYTYSIALLASILGTLFSNLLENSPAKFKAYKIGVIIISVFTLFFAGVFYSSSMNNGGTLSEINYSIDWWQLIFLILSVSIAAYSFSTVKLEENYDVFKHLDNYSARADEKIKKMNKKSGDLKTDSKGNRI